MIIIYYHDFRLFHIGAIGTKNNLEAQRASCDIESLIVAVVIEAICLVSL